MNTYHHCRKPTFKWGGNPVVLLVMSMVIAACTPSIELSPTLVMTTDVPAITNTITKSSPSQTLTLVLTSATPSSPSITKPPTRLVPTDTPIPTATVTIMGFHTVKVDETLLCIARAYGVLPDAIAQANSLLAPTYRILVGSTLRIPSVRWLGISQGVTCSPQFESPWGVKLPTAIPTQDSTSVPPPQPSQDSTPVPLPQPSPTPTLCVITTLPCTTPNPSAIPYP